MAVNLGGSTSARQGHGVSRMAMVREVNTLAIMYEHPPYDGRYGHLLMWQLHGVSRKTKVQEVNTLATAYETLLVW